MKALLQSTAAAAALLVGLGAAQAQDPSANQTAHMQVMHQTGSWQTSAGINDHGYPMCVTGMTGTLGEDGPGTAGSISLKWDTHYPNYLLVHIHKLGQHAWAIPNNTKMSVVLKVDNAPPLRFNAVGFGHMIQIGIGLNYVDPATGEKTITLLTNLLSNGMQLSVYFLDYPGETHWTAPLNGSAAEIVQLNQCIGGISQAAEQRQQNQGEARIPTAPEQPEQRQIPTAPSQQTPTYRQL